LVAVATTYYLHCNPEPALNTINWNATGQSSPSYLS
jgi:hypothetical protein